MVTHKVDSRGTSCPGPITDLIRAYRKSENGDIIELLATDPGVKADSMSWCEKTGNEFMDIKEEEGVYTIHIRVAALKESFS